MRQRTSRANQKPKNIDLLFKIEMNKRHNGTVIVSVDSAITLSRKPIRHPPVARFKKFRQISFLNSLY